MALIIENAGGKVIQRAPEISGAEETRFYAVLAPGDTLPGVSAQHSVISPETLLRAVMNQDKALLKVK
jgi:hypothetical protein